MTFQTDMLAFCNSDNGKKALTAVLVGALNANDGKKALRSAVQAELEEGFANHKTDGHADPKEVFSNQEWLFDAVDGLSKDLKDIFDILRELKDKV
jgi:hypothetical protein